MLPLGPISYGDSPYAGTSAFAGNPYYIDLEELIIEGLLQLDQVKSVDWGNDPNTIDYSALYREIQYIKNCFIIVSIIREGLYRFLQENSFGLDDYALRMAAKRQFNDKEWLGWPKEIMLREPQTKDLLKELQEQVDF